MGISFSSGRRNQNHHHPHHVHNNYYHPPPPPPPPPPPYVSPYAQPPPPPQQQPPYGQYPANPYQYNYNYQYYPPPPPTTTAAHGWYSNNVGNYGNPMWSGGGYGNEWHQMREASTTTAVVPVPPYVEHQNAKVVKNDVNVHKDTIKLLVDDAFPYHFLVSFVFDAHFDGSITIYYFAKEDKKNCKFTTASTIRISPVKVPFEKGIAQRFQQPSGTGVDLGFFEMECLEKPTKEDVFPLVIFAEVHSAVGERDYDVQGSSTDCYQRVQVTQAVLEKKNDGPFQAKVIKQILWIDGIRYELRELYGIGNASSESFNDDDPGKECVICMTEPKTTAVIPCRHLCMCSDCAKELSLRSDKCPICRQSISELIEININNTNE